ncbi:mitochondrial sodium/calcium exchanger protein-like [Cephus cinctus]|uniref:Mitochondrial sodium/calcium exchanger protein-like n=1 Tax=Cephus cinctus TaxID=211228 RepID=A0AAJ7FSI6_CEPCN|nr:mitochondrial sodium/calcium exchanger protein-like [Cephus cinctus]
MKFRGLRYYGASGALPIKEDQCSYLWNIAPKDRCEWIKYTFDCETDSLIQYTENLFCIFDTEQPGLFAIGLILNVLWLLYLFLILGTTADNFFCPSLAVIATLLSLSENIAGVTILAFGNGAPDIFTSLVSDPDESIIIFTELIGAGIFVTAVIIGSVAIVSPFRVTIKPFMRDACFYAMAVAWISFVVRDEAIDLWEAISFILIYIIFICVVVLMQMRQNREESRKTRMPNVNDIEILNTYLANRNEHSAPSLVLRPRAFSLQVKLEMAKAAEAIRAKALGETYLRTDTNTGEEAGRSASRRPKGLFKEFFFDMSPFNLDEWRKTNIFLKIVLILRVPFMIVLQLFVPVVDQLVENRGWSKLLNCLQICILPTAILFILKLWDQWIGPIPILPVVFGTTALIAIIVFRNTSVGRVPKYHNVFAILGFMAAMVVVYMVAQEVLAVLQCIGHAGGISDAMLGITFLSWGNSVGDLISNVTIAKQGFPRMGFSACFGGPMFNTLLGFGLTYGIGCIQSSNFQIRLRVSDMAPGCIMFLLTSIFISIVYLNTTGGIARRSYGYLLFSLYLIFLVINFLSEIHYIHPLGTDHHEDDYDYE